MLRFYKVIAISEGQSISLSAWPLYALTASINALIIDIKGTHLNVSRKKCTWSFRESLLKVIDEHVLINLLCLFFHPEEMDFRCW